MRKAILTDAESIAACMLFAMEEIVFAFIGERNAEKSLACMLHFVREQNNQYSWQNCWVVEVEGRIAAAVNVYDGALLHELRRPVIDYIKNKFQRVINPEDETQAGEFYIDSLGVYPEHRCKGIATTLLQFLIDEYVDRRGHTLGLLVDANNLKAKGLYAKLGFKLSGKKELMGKELEHLQISA